MREEERVTVCSLQDFISKEFKLRIQSLHVKAYD